MEELIHRSEDMCAICGSFFVEDKCPYEKCPKFGENYSVAYVLSLPDDLIDNWETNQKPRDHSR